MTHSEQTPIGVEFGASSTADEVLDGIDMGGTTAVVTGGYSGLGLETTRSLARAGARVIVPARRMDAALSAVGALSGVTVIPMDLADLDSVRSAAERVAAETERLELLITAAGVMASPERRVGPGWESQFAINHLGHFALINRLFPLLADADDARVVTYSSVGHHLSDLRWDDMHFGTGYDKWLAYGQAKTANVLTAVHLDALGRTSGVRAFSLHPGSIITGLQRDMTRAEQVERGWIDENGTVIGAGFKSAAQGAATGLWAATSPALEGRGGLYCEDCDVAPVAAPGSPIEDGGVREYALDAHAAERLWRESARLTGVDAFGTGAR